MGNSFESNPVMAKESVFETEEKAELKLLQTGDKVRVLRSSGEVEGDWNIIGFDGQTGNAQVEKQVKGGKYNKTISEIELYALNAPEGSSVKFPVKDWIYLYNSLNLHYTDTIKELPSEVSQDDLLTTNEARVLIRELVEKNKNILAGKRVIFRGTPEEGKIRSKKREVLFSMAEESVSEEEQPTLII